MAQSVKHKRSALLVNGSPKLPTTSQLEVGEIAINFAEGHETLSTRNNNNGIATFSSDAMLDKKYISSGAVVSAISAVTKTIEDNEYVIAQAFNNQNDRIEALEDAGFLTGYTETDPTVPAWAKASTKPTYTANEVGAMATSERGNYSTTGHTHSEYFPSSGGTITNGQMSTSISPGEIQLITASGTRVIIGGDDEDFDGEIRIGGTVYRDGSLSDLDKHGNVLLPSGKTGTMALVEDIPTESSIANSGFTKNALTAYTETDPTVPAWAKASTKPSYTAAEVGALSTATTYFDDVEYDSGTKRINFKKNSSVIDYVDATDFIKDGMVSSVTVSNGNLVISFNTEAGKEDIELALTQIFNPNNYYDKTTADGKFLSGFTETDPTVPAWAKVSTKPTYTANEVGALPTGTTLDGIADGSTRKLSDYSLTGHTHDNYSLTSHTHSNYSLTSHTHTAAEVGALPDTTEIPTQASIANSGFTKNTGTLTGVTINGTPATVSNGVASATVSGLPLVSASDNGKILQVVNGQWTLVTPTVVYTGNGTPDNLLGNNGDIYLQTS